MRKIKSPTTSKQIKDGVGLGLIFKLANGNINNSN